MATAIGNSSCLIRVLFAGVRSEYASRGVANERGLARETRKRDAPSLLKADAPLKGTGLFLGTTSRDCHVDRKYGVCSQLIITLRVLVRRLL